MAYRKCWAPVNKAQAQAAGRHAETMALEFLQRQGLQLLARNYRCPQGELDLVMQDREMTVFVEVRARASAAYGSAADSVTALKRGRLTRAAQHYLQRANRGVWPPARFDVVTVEPGAQESGCDWIRDAFSVPS